MTGTYEMLVVTCIIIIGVLVLEQAVILNNVKHPLKYVCIGLSVFSIFRYLTLIVYGNHPTYGQLEALCYFYFASSIGLTGITASVVWHITPYIRESISYKVYGLLGIPFILFYLYVIIKQPTVITQGASYGYVLELVGQNSKYLAIVQGSFVTIICILCMIGIVLYKHPYLRSQYIVLICAQVLLTLDGLSYMNPSLRLFPPFTVSEGIGFLATLYGFLEHEKIRASL